MKIYNAKNQIYSIDKIEYSTYMNLVDLKKILNIEDLKMGCRQVELQPAGEKARLCGYRSKIIATVPTDLFFYALVFSSLEVFVTTYVEFAKDVFYETEDEASHVSYGLMELLRKKYTNKVKIMDYSDSYNSTKTAYENGCFAEKTLYLGNDIFKFVLYPRISKINNKPCIHSEWRIRGSRNIQNKLRIDLPGHCLFFDVEHDYEYLTEKYIVIEEIDTEKLGKYFLGWGRRKNLKKK